MMSVLLVALLLATALCVFGVNDRAHPPPTRRSPSTAPAPSPIPFPYIPKPVIFVEEDYDGDEYYVDDEDSLPELPFQYHHPTDDSLPTDFFPWGGLFKTPKIFWEDQDEEKHKPTPVVILNPGLQRFGGSCCRLTSVDNTVSSARTRSSAATASKTVAEGVTSGDGTSNVEGGSEIFTAEQEAAADR